MAGDTGWTRENVRHGLAMIRQGRNPAARVYESIGPNFFLAPAPGWLNLGLWDGGGEEAEAPQAVRRLVETLAEPLPREAVILDVGNGLGSQDPVIAAVSRPSRLVAINITLAQLRAGRSRLDEAGALAVAGDATRLPFRGGSVDGVISVEAAFHFRSRQAFFVEARRVLRPGGVISMSDVVTQRKPKTLPELLAGLGQLRLWGLRPSAAASEAEIARQVQAAGFIDVHTELCGGKVIDPALALTRHRLESARGLPRTQLIAGRIFLRQVELLRRREMIDYLILRASIPGS